MYRHLLEIEAGLPCLKNPQIKKTFVSHPLNSFIKNEILGLNIIEIIYVKNIFQKENDIFNIHTHFYNNT